MADISRTLMCTAVAGDENTYGVGTNTDWLRRHGIRRGQRVDERVHVPGTLFQYYHEEKGGPQVGRGR